MPNPIEHPFGGFMTGNIDALVLDPVGHAPHTVIQSSDAWLVRAQWDVSGLVVPYMDGTWTLQVVAERIGADVPTTVLGTLTEPFGPAAPSHNYSRDINVPAGTLDPGAYRLVTLLTFDHFGMPLEIASFVEGPIIQIYQFP